MSEFQINERRNWKAQTFPYDHYIPDETEECQYCLTEKQAEIIRGIIEPLGWKTRWWSDIDQEINQDAIEEFRDDISRRLMMSCCGGESPIRYRYTSEGILQQSTDEGVTWIDAPNNDPRNYSPQFPPMTGSDGTNKRCLASRGMEQLIKEQVRDQLTDGMSRYTLEQLVKDWVTTYIETSNPFQALITVVTNQIFALVIATLRPALTDEVFSTLQCIFYKRMLPDASYDSSRWELVRSDILSQITGIAGIFLEHLIYLLGVAGLTNLARSNGYTGEDDNCADCDGCPSFYFLTSDEGWVAGPEFGNPGGEWVDGLGWRDTYVNLSSNYNNYIHIESPYTSCEGLWDISIDVKCIEAYGSNVHMSFFHNGYSVANDFMPTTGQTYHFDYPGVSAGAGLPFVIKINSFAVQIAVENMVLTPTP